MLIRIGTRKSKLALIQTDMLINEIKKHFPDTEIQLVHITTRGDRILDKPLSEISGKGLFITEIENALLNDEIDIAVHSAKDLPYKTAEGLTIGGVLKRGNYHDALVTLKDKNAEDKPSYIVGTGSLRRKINLRRSFQNVSFKDIRGNVDTRISKLKNGEYDAVILAYAGLERLSITNDNELDITPFDYDSFLPAPCQGIIAAECKIGSSAEKILKEINDEKTFVSFETERKVLSLLDADCDMPVGAYSEINGDKIKLCVSNNSINFISGEDEISNAIMLAERLTKQL